MNYIQTICVLFLIPSFIIVGNAESINIYPSENSYTDSLSPAENFGTDIYLKTWSASNRQQRTYLTFYVPEYTDSATVNIYLQNYGGSSFKIYRTTSDWIESDITYKNGRPILESNTVVDELPNNGAGTWYSFDVSSVVSEPGYYSFYIATQWGYKNEFFSSRAETNQPYMRITTRESEKDIVYNTKTMNSSYSFIVDKNDEITFTIQAPDSDRIIDYTWYVNKEKQNQNTKDFKFIVPAGDISQPSSCIWEVRVEGLYDNNTPIIREWLISCLTEEEAPDFIDYFIDQDNRWRRGYILDPWGRQFPSYDQTTNFISSGYYTGSDTSTGKVLSTKFDITNGTFKYKVRNPGVLTISYFKVTGEMEPRYTDGSLIAPSWRYELTSNEFHDYFAILNYRIGFGDVDGRYSWGSYIPISRRTLGQAPGFQWWKGDDWKDITIVKTDDGWWSIWENGVLVPHSYANFEDAFNSATKLTLASCGTLEMDCIEVYKDRYIYPETTIYYGTYPKWWHLADISNNKFDPVDAEGIIVAGKGISLKQIADTIDDPNLITYDTTTRTANLKTNIFFVAGSEFIMDSETLVVDTSSNSYFIDIKPGVTFKVLKSKITATDTPLIWNIASSVSMEVFDPGATRNQVAVSGTSRNNGIYDFRGSFILEQSVIDNSCNLFLDAPYEVSLKDVVFSNHSSSDYGDYTLRGTYENHNQKIRQSYGEKGLWIVPRIDLVTYSISNVRFVNPKTNVNFKVIGGEWIQNATTVRDSDFSQIDVLAMKALKQEYFVVYREKNEKATLALLNTLFDEERLIIGGHSLFGGIYEYNEASIDIKYYLDVVVEDNTNILKDSIITIDSSNSLFPSESLYEYREYITDAYGPGEGGATNYGPTNPQNDTYNGGTYTRWYNALPLGTAVINSNGHTALPNSGDPKNSVVLIDYVLTSDNGNLKKESLSYTLTATAPSGQSVSLPGIDPDTTWYRENPNVPTYTITAVIPDSSTIGPSIIGFAPSEDNPFVPGESKKFRVWMNEAMTSMNWFVDGNLVSTGSLEYNWDIMEGSHTVVFEGSNANGAVMQSWSVTESAHTPVPESSGGSGLFFTPSATSFTSSVGSSTIFSVDSEEQFTSAKWYFNGAEVASGTSYTQNWAASGTFTVRFDGATDLGTLSRTWDVVVSGSEYSDISIIPSASTVKPGETFSLDVYIDPKQPVTGSQLNLQYGTLASVTSVRDGGLFSSGGLTSTFQSGLIDNSAGLLKNVYSAIVGSGTVTAPGSMATVNMVAGSSSGLLELTMSNVVLSDAYSNPAPYDISYASVLVDTAPVFNTIPAMSVEEESTLTFTVSATDADGDLLTYSCTSLPEGATFDASAKTFRWTPSRGQAGTYSVQFSVTDGYLNDTAATTITVSTLDRTPIITLFEPASGSVFEEGRTIDMRVVAEDPEGKTLSYIMTINGVQVSSSASYQWVTDYSSAGTHSIGVTVSDGNSQASRTHTITITDVHPRWDVNQDGVVNILDITLVGQNYGRTYTGTLPRWDINQDGIVNVQDMSIVAGRFGETVH